MDHYKIYRYVILLFILFLMVGCAHYVVNQSLAQVDPDSRYRGKFMGQPGNSDGLLLYLTFSEGGTRASAFSYGVLKELKITKVTINGKTRRLVDEVDAISAVSGGSFTAGYYGLFGEQIFEDFEARFFEKKYFWCSNTEDFSEPDNLGPPFLPLF